MSEITPTRAAVLELNEERNAMREGYEFLDEKRLLLAARMLRELQDYQAAWQAWQADLAAAAAALRAAVMRHGIEGLEVYPAASLEDLALSLNTQRLLGVRLIDAGLDAQLRPQREALFPSAEAERCRGLFFSLLKQGTALAAHASNLERLQREYRRTERRARALEDVLMPEINTTINELESRLEEIDQEEAIRVRQV